MPYLTEITATYSAWEGATVLKLLAQHPNTPIYASVLEIAIQHSIPIIEAQHNFWHLAPIKMTDDATLRAVDKRLNQLLMRKAELLSRPAELTTENTEVGARCVRPNPEDSYQKGERNSPLQIEEEISALTAYRKETTIPTGSIKCFHDEDRAAYRRQSAAIRRLLAKATQDGHHEAVAYIKHHLKQGKLMIWEL